MSLPPSEIPSGAMRFNSDSQKLEYWDGSQWVQVHTFSPNLATPGDPTPGARGVFGGGMSAFPSTQVSTIDYINISSTGDALDFGDLATARDSNSSTSSKTRGIWFGGNDPGVSGIDEIDFITIASTGTATDWGVNQTTAQRNHGAVGNETRGIYAGTSASVVIEYVTIASAGTRNNFGNLVTACNGGGGVSSPVRGVFMGADNPTNLNTIQFITIATTGDSKDFGDLIAATGHPSNGNVSNGKRGVIAGGQAPGNTNVIQYITISTTGNAINFGDLTLARRNLGAVCNSTRGSFAGGWLAPDLTSSALTNVIDYINISTEGNAVDFGDLFQPRRGSAGCSNAHGGL